MARTRLVGPQYQATMGSRSKSSELSGPSAVIRSRMCRARSACATNVSPSWRASARSQAMRYQGSSARGRMESDLLYASKSARRSYRSSSVQAGR